MPSGRPAELSGGNNIVEGLSNARGITLLEIMLSALLPAQFSGN